MTKLIIQIPCYNEEATLGITLSALPREIPGVDIIEWLVIDDGSTDKTVEVAKSHGVNHIISHPRNEGLSRAFKTGIQACLKAGADIIVNTDADNQYRADDIPALVTPILEGKADIVIGARPIGEIEHFSLLKKCLQKIGSWVVRQMSSTDIPDAPSGFRAMSRNAAMRLHIFNAYTYTMEATIQAGQKGMMILSVPIKVNKQLRPSRLVRNNFEYVKQQAITIIRSFVTYRPFRFFALPGLIAFTLGMMLGLRFLYYSFILGLPTGKIQSLILAALLMGGGFFWMTTALLADLISVNRRLLESLYWRVQQIEENVEKMQTWDTSPREKK
ncbi:glycosyl transferase family 2 [Candidatus Vecturithrix granuli]|uniref:Glycosyl transferase family 2 n=1 Tax=Vecturithrix granuli TaxID=1499967 RepID=A0A081C2M6_VECG1|nr:glycosyl transferase family 2 [Candidatus Vecturithrix granuli]